MKRIVYLHGLESEQGGPKVDYLLQYHHVLAPHMDYTDPDCFINTITQIEVFRPHLIIGSSMGGYFAMAISSYVDVPVLLFNPALHSRSVESENVIWGNRVTSGKVILGVDDMVIDPVETIKVIKYSKLQYDLVDGLGHSIPYDIFIEKFQHFIQNN